jgi:hypothetical protein
MSMTMHAYLHPEDIRTLILVIQTIVPGLTEAQKTAISQAFTNLEIVPVYENPHNNFIISEEEGA